MPNEVGAREEEFALGSEVAGVDGVADSEKEG